MSRPDHLDHADEAESAELEKALPQALALWERAIETCPGRTPINQFPQTAAQV